MKVKPLMTSIKDNNIVGHQFVDDGRFREVRREASPVNDFVLRDPI